MTKSNKNQEELNKLLARAQNAEAEVRNLRQHKTQFQKLYDTTVESFSNGRVPRRLGNGDFDGLSFIIAYYDIPDQLERTLVSCSPEYQGVASDQIEVIIADNGSNIRPHDGLQERFPFVSAILRTEGKPSPVFAVNKAIREARFSNVAIMLDGAHMLSPGIVRNVMDVCETFDRPVINVPQYIFGNVSQNLHSEPDAFRLEQKVLDRLDWPENGYALFSHALLPGERPIRNYFGATESNCLITSKAVLKACGGFDERFDEPGAGFANLELFSRLTNHPENNYVLLPGEGSFHQDHDGTTTGKSPEVRERAVEKFRQRHKEITGSEVLLNPRSPFLYGEVRLSTLKIPTISKEFGQVRQRILEELADIYVLRAKAGIKDKNHPILASNATPLERRAFRPLAPLGLIENEERFANRKPVDLSYMSFLREIHQVRNPQLYFEIGVDSGASMKLSTCNSIGVDPAYHITSDITAPARLFRITSDKFFENEARCKRLLGDGIDFSFIDGMHLAEYVLRDFINVEKWCNPDGVIVLDDVLPEQMEMAARERDFNAWCGDVYKMIAVLRKYRPELQIDVFEAFIGPYRKGLAIIKNLDPQSTVLSDFYDDIAADLVGQTYSVNSIRALEELVGITATTSLEEFSKAMAS